MKKGKEKNKPQTPKIKTSEILDPTMKIFQHIESSTDSYVELLKEAVSIPSVSLSNLPSHSAELLKMGYWLARKLRCTGFQVELCELDLQQEGDIVISPPPAIFAQFGNDPNKETVAFYSHYDVFEAKNISWDTDPFCLTQKGGRLCGRGTSRNKGPILCWINAVEAYQQTGIELPVNVKFIIEGMGECESLGLKEVLKEKKLFLENVTFVCTCNALWLDNQTPALCYGYRGMCVFDIVVDCAKKDLSSSHFSGLIYEATKDVLYLLESLIGGFDGSKKIPGLFDDVEPLSVDEEKRYSSITFDIDKYQRNLGCKKVQHNNDKINLLVSKWRFPSISILFVKGGHVKMETGIISKRVRASFAVQTVPNQDSAKIHKFVEDFLEGQWRKRNSVNTFKLEFHEHTKPCQIPTDNDNFKAATNATKLVYSKTPDLILGGFGNSIIGYLQETLQKTLLFLPIGTSDDCVLSQNEKISLRNYIGGTKLVAAYLKELALQRKCAEDAKQVIPIESVQKL